MTMITPPTPTPRTHRAATADELLEFERRRALDDIKFSARRFGRDLVDSTGLRRHSRNRPLLTTTVGAVLGYFAGRTLLHLLNRHERAPRPAGSPIVPALILASLRLFGR